ncbi:MFS transporter [Brevibacterium salitolerans]|uniref:MFS transporter n=1 Tax=Brevibacterium salitolerans TaxID=1403566 RepID=A0ABN2X199_9MICO
MSPEGVPQGPASPHVSGSPQELASPQGPGPFHHPDSASSSAGGSAFARLLDRQGISRTLAWGFLALMLFMVGDGIELSFLSNHLTELGFGGGRVALLFTTYGIVVAVAAWLAGALAESWGPRRVMLAGGIIWIVFEVVFLLLGVMPGNYPVMILAYSVRAVGYPFFAYGFLVWVTMETPDRVMGKAVGWYWFFNAMGLGVISGYFVAIVVEPWGALGTLWSSLVFVALATLMVAVLIRSRPGASRMSREQTVRGLVTSVTIMAERPKVALGGLLRIINTMSYYSFAVFLGVYMVGTVGFSQAQWSSIWGTMLFANVLANVISGYASDLCGRLNVIAWGGGFATAITVLGFYYVPQGLGANYPVVLVLGIVYGLALGMYVPLSAVVPLLAPQNKAAAVAVLNLGAGLSNFVGPAIAGLVPLMGVAPVVWVLAAIYLVGLFLTFLLREPGIEAPRIERKRTSAEGITSSGRAHAAGAEAIAAAGAGAPAEAKSALRQ